MAHCPPPTRVLVWLALAAGGPWALTAAAGADVFRCAGPDGAVIYANTPCSRQGARQERRLRPDELRGNVVRTRRPPPSTLPALPLPPPPGSAPAREVPGAASGDPDPLLREGPPPEGLPSGVRHPVLERLQRR